MTHYAAIDRDGFCVGIGHSPDAIQADMRCAWGDDADLTAYRFVPCSGALVDLLEAQGGCWPCVVVDGVATLVEE